MKMRDIMRLVEGTGIAPVLFHGTCPDNAASLVRNGWIPRSGSHGSNMGQTRYLYLTTGREDALWFAEQKGCDTVVEVHNVPLDHLIVDPEDGGADSLHDEMNSIHGLPGKVALIKPLPAIHFHLSGS
jgi:hypothetical protein